MPENRSIFCFFIVYSKKGRFGNSEHGLHNKISIAARISIKAEAFVAGVHYDQLQVHPQLVGLLNSLSERVKVIEFQTSSIDKYRQ